MPEIGEVARIVHFLRKHLTNRTIASVQTTEDPIVYNAKVGTTAASFAAALKGKTVLDARQQGKYFWLVLSEKPHPLFHFGMTGWVKFSNEETMYKPGKEEDGSEGSDADAGTRYGVKGQEWPPKFNKFILKFQGEPRCEVAFVDKRRLARIRLVDAAAEDMRRTSPLKENGPDPVIDKETLTAEWLAAKLQKKRVPIKALLLDQANISGVGNWVADEVLYHAKIHPEQYSNTLSEAQMKQLHDSLMYVCTVACENLADSSKYPKEWLFKHRWNKGKKGETKNVLPNGEKIMHVTVGGRTSAIVPSVQKKTGPVAADVDEDGESEGEEEKPDVKKKAKPSKRKAKDDVLVKAGADEKKEKPSKRKAKREAPIKAEDDEDMVEEPKSKRAKASLSAKSVGGEKAAPARKTNANPVKAAGVLTDGAANGTRKSKRLSGAS